MARKKKSNDSPGGANWMDTYGDLVTLLLTFFVLLFSFSTINEQKWKKLVAAFSGNYSPEIGMDEDPSGDFDLPDKKTENPGSTPTPGQTNTPNPGSTVSPVDINPLYEEIKGFIKGSGLDAKVEVSKTDFEIIIRFSDSVMFDSGKADLKGNAKVVLDDISKVLVKYISEIEMVRIEGHTDNKPIHTTRFPSNWELSTTRAVEVLRYLIETKDLSSQKISAVGYGEHHPVASNANEEGRSKNRRVDFVITKSLNAK